MKISFEMKFYAHKDYGGLGNPNELRIEFTDVMGKTHTINQYFSYEEWNNDEIKALLINKLFYSLEDKLFNKIPPLLANKSIEAFNK